MTSRHLTSNSIMGITLAFCGCGLIEVQRTVFPNQPTGADGELLYFEDLEDITSDNSLLLAQMQDALRNLGLNSEDLITSIADDGLGTTQTPTAPADDTTTTDSGGDGGDGSGTSGG